MASTSKFLLLLIISIFLISLSQVSSSSSSEAGIEAQAHQPQVVKGPNRRFLGFVDCGSLCAVRCGKHSRPNVCTRACGTCCQRCNCVPPGTHGNREQCGSCYTDMLTHGNRPKCP
ncbi:snakin-2 [Lactuca sativa]|uniref:snakin-2 n=1 Tax=Lactuca sativa TaxID=4236 RepID=UPI000CAF543A|nr:snakin-2 [Lactuca sativa]